MISNCVNLGELSGLLSGLSVKTVMTTGQPDFHAEFAETDAALAKKH
jgi:hypothetical protein